MWLVKIALKAPTAAAFLFLPLAPSLSKAYGVFCRRRRMKHLRRCTREHLI